VFDLKSETCIHDVHFFLKRVVKSLQRSKGGGRERGTVLKVMGEGERSHMGDRYSKPSAAQSF